MPQRDLVKASESSCKSVVWLVITTTEPAFVWIEQRRHCDFVEASESFGGFLLETCSILASDPYLVRTRGPLDDSNQRLVIGKRIIAQA